MEQYIFDIIDIDVNSKYRLRHCPDGWRDYGVSFGREDDVSNVVKSYSGNWSFIKEDGDYIWGVFSYFGPNRRLKLVISSLEDGLSGRYRTEYVGYLDLTQIERDGAMVNVPINEGGFFKALENRWSEDYSYPYDRFLKVNGNVFSETAHFTSPDSVSGQITTGQNSEYGYILTGGQITNSDHISDVFFQNTNIQHLKEYYAGSVWNEPTKLYSGNAMMVTKNRVVRKMTIDYSIILQYYIDGLEINYRCRTLESTASLYLVSCPISEPVSISRDNPNLIWRKIGEVTTQSEVKDNTVGSTNKVVIRPTMSGSVTIDNFTCSDAEAEGYAVFAIMEVRYGRQISDNPRQTFLPAKNFPGGNYNVRFILYNVSVSYEQRINTNKNASAIKSVDIFRNLIGSINNGRYDVDIDTSEFEAVAANDLLTSRSGMRRKIALRGRQRYYAVNGDITTNLGAFLSYCYAVYGFKLGVDYDMEADRYRVFLSHSDRMYSDSLICRLDRIRDVRFSVWRDVLYSSVVVGYEKDEDAINSERDFNCLYTLSTPNTEIERNELRIVSPYSASSRSFETELYKEYDNTEGDTDGGTIYVVSAAYSHTDNISGSDVWILSRDIPVDSGSLFPEEEYNVKFSPQRMLQRHKVELNGYFAFEAGKTIKVETCDGNSSIVAGGIRETFSQKSYKSTQYNASKINLQDSLERKRYMFVVGADRRFRPVSISVASIGDSSLISKIAANRLGFVSFKHNGMTYRGYIAHTTNAVTIHPMDEKECVFELLMAEDSDFPQ